MKWFDNIKAEHASKQLTIDSINEELKNDTYEVELVDKDGKVLSIVKKKTDAKHRVELLDMKRTVKLNGTETSDIVKVVANIVVVMVLVGFEMGNILNQKGSKFIKTL